MHERQKNIPYELLRWNNSFRECEHAFDIAIYAITATIHISVTVNLPSKFLSLLGGLIPLTVTSRNPPQQLYILIRTFSLVANTSY